ncbi:MAG TPA: MauE/DoxX family redox-associated membrane protein [Archangium sp.]|uniref:MauE/DoxX family redox-associated membrane protein n=1 Tax=Archangium sp. TaxID=1872627 RepID=UPI002E33F999|nr:MauE/DoxX family redox-associated membrane protein [Archangium sp.]HEX5745931.1 MauE/DoxX family redox-associated membrane protein [Archangium sp.]
MPEQETPRVSQVAILVLSVEWLFFGSTHFAFRELAEAQIPDFIPFKTFVAISTGMAEVVIGILILLPSTRRWAALASLVLLGLFVPAVYNILANDSAIPGSVAWRNLWRVTVVPNNVMLVLFALHLWRSRESAAMGPAQALEAVLTRRREPRRPGPPLMVAGVMLAANTAGFVGIWASRWASETAGFWGLMCLATGALVGFLFGVPRVTLDAVRWGTHRPNSNIEVVSDWLTKTLVGVGLIEFHAIGGFVRNISAELGRALSLQAGDQVEGLATSFAQAIIVYFFVAGIIQGYLLTRMYLSTQFEEYESPAVGAKEP